jgi:hypothetical protein
MPMAAGDRLGPGTSSRNLSSTQAVKPEPGAGPGRDCPLPVRVRIHLSLFVTSRLKKNPTEPSPGMVTCREFRVFGRIVKARLCFPETQNFKVRKYARHGFSKIMRNSVLFLLSNPILSIVHVRIQSFLALLAGICV